MRKIGFIGSYDKTDMLLYIAKILTVLKKKILIIDSTLMQKSKYTVPALTPTRKYVTTYEDIDVAIGFDDEQDLRDYMLLDENESFEYDYALVDIDTSDIFENFGMQITDLIYFVTSFDVYCLKRGIEALNGLKDTISAKKVLYTKNMLKEEDEYLNFLSMNSKVIWKEERIFFPFEQGDQSVIFENQRMSKIKLRNLSNQYVEGIITITNEISGESINDIRKAIKIIEKS